MPGFNYTSRFDLTRLEGEFNTLTIREINAKIASIQASLQDESPNASFYAQNHVAKLRRELHRLQSYLHIKETFLANRSSLSPRPA